MRIAWLLLLSLVTSCAHSVQMISVPAGAKIYKSGKPIGTAPFIYHERSGPPIRSVKLTADLPGYPQMEIKERVGLCTSPGNLLLDAFVVGLFFGFCMKSEYVFDFAKTQDAAARP